MFARGRVCRDCLAHFLLSDTFMANACTSDNPQPKLKLLLFGGFVCVLLNDAG